MRLRAALPLLAAVLAVAVLAVAVVALAHQRQSGRAAVPQPACAPPAHGNHKVVVERLRAAVLLYVPPGRPVGRRRLVVVLPDAGSPDSRAGAVGPFVDAWRRRDACPARPRRRAPAARVLELRWDCPAGRVVVHDRVLDAQHGWPGEASLRPFSSTLRTWRFLSAFTDELQRSA